MGKKRANSEGSIRKRKDSRWEGFYTASYDPAPGKQKIKNVLGKTQAEIKEKLKKAIADSQRLDMNRSGTHTVKSWVTMWYEVYAEPRLRENTKDYYLNYINNHIIPQLGDIKLDKLTTIQIQKFYNDLQKNGRVQRYQHIQLKNKGLSVRVVHGIHTLLNNCLEQAVAERLILVNPARGRKLPKMEKREMKVLPEEKITLGEFFGGTKWYPTSTPAPIFGLIPLLLGTLLVSIGAIVLSLPFGIAVAIYMAEIANKRTRDLLKPIIELLAGIPSVVYGFFGLVVIVPLIQKTFDLPVGETAFAGSVVLAIMALPTIITVAEDAMRTTPRAMKEASLALGATQWQTIYKVIIPYSISGITSAVVLGIGRAIGETMAVLMVTGNAAVIPTSFFEPVRTIPATIAAELGEAPAGGAHYEALFLLGAVLFLITLILSISVEYISSKRKI